MDHDGTVTHSVVVPNALVDVIQGIYLSPVARQQFQNFEFRIGQGDPFTAFHNGLTVKIQRNIADSKFVFLLFG